MRIIAHGAAREVTGSCHELIIEKGGPSTHSAGSGQAGSGRVKSNTRILLDCGLFQGRRREAAEKNATFSFDPANNIDALILSHAHMDHVGRIPVLWKKGYRGKVYCTYATKDLAAVMLQDGGYIQEKDEEYFCKHLGQSMLQCDGPLYTQVHAIACMELFEGKNYNEWFEVVPPSTGSGQAGVRAMFIEAGHVLGAAMVVLEVQETKETKEIRVGFSGDLGRSALPIIRDPAPMPEVTVLICESTYGNRTHTNVSSAKAILKDAILRTAKRGGKVLIPAFSLERTQEIVYDLHLLWDARAIPPIPIYIDSPLATKVTEIFMRHPECYDKEMYEQFLSRAHNPFQFSLLKYTESVEESKDLNGMPGPMIIMAGSGMCEAGRIRHHLKNDIEDARNTVVAVGYMAQYTLGRRIIDPEVREVKIFDRMYTKKAETLSIDAYSGHADRDDLDAYVSKVDGLKKLILVHGEITEMEPFAQRMREGLNIQVLMPQRGEELVLG